MSAPDEKEDIAAVGFVGFMTMALGPFGFLVAAVSVGVERMWSGGRTERSRSRERGAGWLDEQRDWLGADHKLRTDRTRKRRDWLASGADPATKPAEPRRRHKVRDAIRRGVANVAIAASDFAGGFKDGWHAAKDVRANGGSLRDIATARPTVCSHCKRTRVPVVADGLCADCRAMADESWRRPTEQEPVPDAGITGAANDGPTTTGGAMPTATTPGRLDGRPYQPRPADEAVAQPRGDGVNTCPRCAGPVSVSPRLGRYCVRCDAVDVDKSSANTCDRCGQPGFGAAVKPQTDMNPSRQLEGVLVHHLNQSTTCPSTAQIRKAQTEAETARSRITPGADKTGYAAVMSWAPNPAAPGTDQQKENTMPETNQTPAPAAPATESNATVLRAKLQTTTGTLQRISELTDQLAAERATLGHQVRDASEFATATGQSAQAQQALDESNQLATSMGEQLGNFSQGAVSAEEQMSQASNGLKVAEDAEDQLRSSGADGRAVAPASGASA